MVTEALNVLTEPERVVMSDENHFRTDSETQSHVKYLNYFARPYS